MLEALRAIPGVEAAGATSSVPFCDNINNSVILAEGYVMKPGESLLAPTQVTRIVRLLRGDAHRRSCAADRSKRATRADAPTTAIIDERLARKFWPDQDAVGRRLYSPDDPKDLTKITRQDALLHDRRRRQGSADDRSEGGLHAGRDVLLSDGAESAARR